VVLHTACVLGCGGGVVGDIYEDAGLVCADLVEEDRGEVAE
jgi:hypothetical protein